MEAVYDRMMLIGAVGRHVSKEIQAGYAEPPRSQPRRQHGRLDLPRPHTAPVEVTGTDTSDGGVVMDGRGLARGGQPHRWWLPGHHRRRRRPPRSRSGSLCMVSSTNKACNLTVAHSTSGHCALTAMTVVAPSSPRWLSSIRVGLSRLPGPHQRTGYRGGISRVANPRAGRPRHPAGTGRHLIDRSQPPAADPHDLTMVGDRRPSTVGRSGSWSTYRSSSARRPVHLRWAKENI